MTWDLTHPLISSCALCDFVARLLYRNFIRVYPCASVDISPDAMGRSPNSGHQSIQRSKPPQGCLVILFFCPRSGDGIGFL